LRLGTTRRYQSEAGAAITGCASISGELDRWENPPCFPRTVASGVDEGVRVITLARQVAAPLRGRVHGHRFIFSADGNKT
jgi:hypothetical protein